MMKALTKTAVILAMFCIGVIVAPLFTIFPKDDTHEG